MIEAGAGDGIDPHSDQAAHDDIARGRRNTARHDLPGDRNVLRGVSRLLERRDKLFVLFDLQRARRDAGEPVAGVNFGAAWRRFERYFVSRSTNHRCTPAAQARECDDQHDFTHDYPPYPCGC